MKLKLKIPLHFYLFGPTELSLKVRTSFNKDGVKVNLKLLSEDPHILSEGPDDSKVFCHLKGAEFELEDTEPQRSKLSKVVTTEPDYVSILKFLLPIVNRVLRSIRNWGVVAFVAELNPKDDDAKKYIQRWDVQSSEDGENWQAVVKPETGLLSVLLSSFFLNDEKAGNLHVKDWSDIEEAIQDNLEPPPEQEFLTNSIEHLNLGNFRLALVEAIICLEIVLTQFLQVFLSIYKIISKSRINDFLSPQFGLKAKVSALLDLILDPNDLKKINVDNVRTAVEWRNGVIHKTGHLPQGVPEEELRRKINDVLSLALLLGRKQEQISSSPELQRIGNQLSQKFRLPNPTILG